jgi:hypothetical protein
MLEYNLGKKSRKFGNKRHFAYMLFDEARILVKNLCGKGTDGEAIIRAAYPTMVEWRSLLTGSTSPIFCF